MVTEVIAVSCGVDPVPGNPAHRHGHRCRPRHPGRDRCRTAALAVAKLLKALVDKEQPGLVILGKQAIDDDANQTGQMLAPWPTCRRPPSPPRWKWLDGKASVTREVDGGLETRAPCRPWSPPTCA